MSRVRSETHQPQLNYPSPEETTTLNLSLFLSSYHCNSSICLFCHVLDSKVNRKKVVSSAIEG